MPRLGASGGWPASPSLGIEEDGGEVGEDACAAEEDERHGADAHEDRVDVEVLRDAGADAADDAIVA